MLIMTPMGYDYPALLSALPKGDRAAHPGDTCGGSPFAIATSNIGNPINDHSTDVINAWVIKRGDVTLGWIAKIRDGRAYYLNPLGFSEYQLITDANAEQLRDTKGVTTAGCFKDDFK